MTYNFQNLSDIDFEALAKDIMGIKLGVSLYRFGKGPDGGIDLCDSSKKIIVQVKHYVNSTVNQLKSALKKDVEKINKHNPENYYVFTSLSVSNKVKEEIVEMFFGYIKDISHIIDKIEIDDFLMNPDNNSILNKHYKLWFTSSDLINKIANRSSFIDSDELLLDIECEIKRFYPTKSYFDCLEKLKKNNVLIITGNPGVGKTIISKMLVLHFSKSDYQVRYVSTGIIKELKDALSFSPEQKEIILLDDFLGQHYLNIKSSAPSEIKSLLGYVKRNKNKIIILNTRITILNELVNKSHDFSKIIQYQEENQYIVDINDTSNLDKAYILYNHFYHSQDLLPYLNIIKSNQNYKKIIKHRNYNPRLIEYITSPMNLKLIQPEEYFKFVKNSLDNPNNVWSDEFNSRLSSVDRIFMNTLYSLTDHAINEDILRCSFDKRVLSDSATDNTINQFDYTLTRLTESLIKIQVNNVRRMISVLNPSINDYIQNQLANNLNERKTIVNKAVYVEQIKRIMDISPHDRIDLFEKNQIDLNHFEKYSASYYYLKNIIDLNIKDNIYTENVKKAFVDLCDNYYYEYETILVDIIVGWVVENYNFTYLYFKKIFNVLEKFKFDNVLKILNFLNKSMDLTNEHYNLFCRALKTSFINYIIHIIDNDLFDLLHYNLEQEYRLYFGEDDLKKVVKKYYSKIEEDIIQLVQDKLDSKLELLPFPSEKIFPNLEEVACDITYQFDIENLIEEHLTSVYYENEFPDEYKRFREEEEETYYEWKEIDDIFIK